MSSVEKTDLTKDPIKAGGSSFERQLSYWWSSHLATKGFICQIYLPAFWRSYGSRALQTVTSLLRSLKKVGFTGVYLIALWRDGGYDRGFDIVDYTINPLFGVDADLTDFIKEAHRLGLAVGVDVVPHHVSDRNVLAVNCLKGTPGYEDCLYVVSEDEARRLTKAGVPSFFGKSPYAKIGDKYVRSTFVDGHQLDLNWNSLAVQNYFRKVFNGLKKRGVDFVRVDCGPMLLEDVTKADPANKLACFQAKKSVKAVRAVAGGVPLFFEWFDMDEVDFFKDMPECWPVDCSYVINGRTDMAKWAHEKVVPLLGGHDQMTAADRGIDISATMELMRKSQFAFIDIPTLVGYRTDPEIEPKDYIYDASLSHDQNANLQDPNQRYRGRRGAYPYVRKFLMFIELLDRVRCMQRWG